MLEVQWIPRTLNQQADYISRLLDTDDWQITDDLFLSLDACWRPHTVDCFANYYNHKLPRFFSRFWNPNTTGVDLVPPVSIVLRVLHYIEVSKGRWYCRCTALAFCLFLAFSNKYVMYPITACILGTSPSPMVGIPIPF